MSGGAMMFDWIKNYALAILASALALALAGAATQTIRLAHLETKFSQHLTLDASQRAASEAQYGRDQAAARSKEKALADSAATTRKEKDEAIATLDHRVSALLERLRTRPDRPAAQTSPASAVASPGPSCTGAGLYRPDGEFLAGEAAAAQRIGFERDACYQRYNAARDALASEHVTP